ncbi:hypothetical protein [Endothiovibrio diazotrophicus]
MNIEQDVDHLQRHLSLHLHNVLPAPLCAGMIARYEHARADGETERVTAELLRECEERLFTGELNTLLDAYFQGPVKPRWPLFEAVDSRASTNLLNTYWHLDTGTRNTHKLFVYLNPVAEHGGNTVMVDVERTKRLRQAGQLPMALDERKQDVTEALEQLGLSTEVLAYDLKAGDAVLFDPITLAHRCLPPREGRLRYTICFSIVPERAPA